MRAITRGIVGSLVVLLALVAGAPAHAASPASSYAKKPVKQIVKDAKTAFAGLTSMHIQGSLRDKGQTTRVNLSVSRAGECAGTLSEGRGTASIIVGPSGAYLKGNAAFWRSNEGAQAAALAGRWFTGFPARLQRELCSAKQLFGILRGGPGHHARLAAVRVHGVPAVRITSKQKDGVYNVYVAATSPHYLLRMDVAGQGQFNLSGFDKPVNTTPPAGAVDLSRLG